MAHCYAELEHKNSPATGALPVMDMYNICSGLIFVCVASIYFETGRHTSFSAWLLEYRHSFIYKTMQTVYESDISNIRAHIFIVFKYYYTGQVFPQMSCGDVMRAVL